MSAITPVAVDRTAADPSTVIVRTRQGRLRGRHADDGVLSFLGIPYAAPPFGPNRLAAPRPVEPWHGVRDATAFGSEPPQPKLPEDVATAMGVWDPATPGEDCLNLNIWTPGPVDKGLPVLVWLAVGMFEVSNGASYDGSRFARDGVVCVTVDSRVGPEGFLWLDDTIPNRGLLDQIAALEWVQANIDVFGGDPTNVTIAGESAGAMSVGTLLSMPPARGLFHRAIAQSGAAHRVIDAASARRVARALVGRLGVDPTLEAVASVSWDRLLAASMALKDELAADPDPERWGLDVVASFLPWQPAIDGDVVPERPIDRIAAGSARDIDLLVGSNTEDWKLFRVLTGDIDRVTEETLTGPVATYGYLSAAAYGLPIASALDAYRRMYPGASPGELLASIQTDWWCRIPALRVADAHAGDPGATYMYEFGWPSPAFGGRLGACHALEIPFVFDTLDTGQRQMLGAMLGPEPPQALATDMHDAWVRFVATGDPGWPQYDLDRRATKRFGTPSTIQDDPRANERAVWSGLM